LSNNTRQAAKESFDTGKNMSKKHHGVERDQDQVWISKEQKFKGILAQVTAFDPDKTRVVVVAHFPSTFRHLESLLQSNSLVYETYPTPLDAQRLATVIEYEAPFKVMLVMANALPVEVRDKNAMFASALEINFVIAEHYPLPAQDDIVINFANKLPYNCKLTFHEAVDSALMQPYGGDNMQKMMYRLKLPENQPISITLIDKTIRRAQEKLAKRVTHHLMADSAEQWFQQNIEEDE
jgi:hypothetical protein